MRLVFDIETNGMLGNVSEVYCVVCQNVDTGEVDEFLPHEIDYALGYLSKADTLVGHNIVSYDLQVLKKLHGFEFKGKVHDTLIASYMLFPTRVRHGLGSWGDTMVRIGLIDSGKMEAPSFDEFTEDMLPYCVQDVAVNMALYKLLQSRMDFDGEPYLLELRTRKLQDEITNFGMSFDAEACHKLITELTVESFEIAKKVDEVLGYSWETKTYKVNKDGGPSHHAENLISKLEVMFPQFNHEMEYQDGAHHIKVPTKVTLDTKALLIAKLKELGWECSWYTAKGNPQITRDGEPEPNLGKIPALAEANLVKYYLNKHRLGLLRGLLKFVREDGRIASEANTHGTITGRFAHRVIANFPSVDTFLGLEIRGLFGAPDGYVQVGSDLSGIEARLLAHYMGDDEFTKAVLYGDIHTDNKEYVQKEFGFTDAEFSRGAAKNFFYGLMYGSGDAKTGHLVKGGAKEGAAIKEAVFKRLPNLRQLTLGIQKQAKKGSIIGLDGRKVMVTKSEDKWGGLSYDSYKALNSLLQSAGAIYFKNWMAEVDRASKAEGLDVHFMVAYHDEIQSACKPEHVERFKEILNRSIEVVDAHFGLRCPNACETKVGKNWAETH
jgi:DNA polymerase I-like protein with 3'-5' exonuclease and polymerase domains